MRNVPTAVNVNTSASWLAGVFRAKVTAMAILAMSSAIARYVTGGRDCSSAHRANPGFFSQITHDYRDAHYKLVRPAGIV